MLPSWGGWYNQGSSGGQEEPQRGVYGNVSYSASPQNFDVLIWWSTAGARPCQCSPILGPCKVDARALGSIKPCITRSCAFRVTRRRGSTLDSLSSGETDVYLHKSSSLSTTGHPLQSFCCLHLSSWQIVQKSHAQSMQSLGGLLGASMHALTVSTRRRVLVGSRWRVLMPIWLVVP